MQKKVQITLFTFIMSKKCIFTHFKVVSYQKNVNLHFLGKFILGSIKLHQKVSFSSLILFYHVKNWRNSVRRISNIEESELDDAF